VFKSDVEDCTQFIVLMIIVKTCKSFRHDDYQNFTDSTKVSYNTPANSTGALFSAQLDVDVVDPEVVFESFEMQLLCSVSVKKPVHPNCPECTTKTTQLKTKNWAEEKPLRLTQGHHAFPISYLFGGHLPATSRAPLVTVEYSISAIAKTATGEKITYQKPINLSRSVLPGNDKHSLRVFPPTNLTANVNLNPVIHPVGEFPVTLRLSGITTKKNDSIVRWRLRKLNWRIEERQKMVSPACTKHALKLGGEGKGILHEDVRNVGEGEIDQIKNPWKCDFSAGEVEAEFQCHINASKKPVCDVEAPNGLSITHNLILEMVVAEEWVANGKPNQVTLTGAARILRTQFHVLLTERAGLGISWDEETPPVYEDVPASPPGYANMTDFDLAAIDGQMEELHLDPNTGVMGGAIASSSHAQRSLSTERPSSSRGRHMITVDDLLSEPNRAPRQETPEEEDEEDVQIVHS
jgi:hypothetical protein